METINYYRKNNTDGDVLLLDKSQALDEINYVKLFQCLVHRKVNPMVICCLLCMYINQHLNIQWKYFSTSNGVKKGGVYFIWYLC